MNSKTTSQDVIRVAVTYRVCQHWRANIFEKIDKFEDIELLVLHGQTVPESKLVNGDNLSGFRHHEMWTLKWPRVRWVFHPAVIFRLAAYRPDVILSEGGSNVLTNCLVFLYAKLTRTPVIWWTLGEIPGHTYDSLPAKAYRWVVVQQEKMSHAMLGYSSVALAYFRKMGYPATKWFRAVNCVDTNRIFADIETREENVAALRKKLDLIDKKVILFVGALAIEKTIDRLIRVFDRLQNKFPDSRLVIVGDGQDEPRLRAIVTQLDLDAKVVFAGRAVEDASDYYELGDVFVMPGLGGLAVSEAMAHGLPVICGIGDGCEIDLVENDATGFRIASNDDEEVEAFIEQHLTLLLANEEKLTVMSESAKSMIENVHNVNTYIANIIDAIRYCARGKRELPVPKIHADLT